MGGKPPPLAAPPPPLPPVTEKSSDVADASRDAKLQAAKRKGLGSTLLAGETGGTGGSSAFGLATGKTLLG
jgi:hypothetical protein